ncbi:MAG: 3-oxoacyl-[acyl-carrier-protein] reductase [SAR202 cluster bacterium]|nr:3-oxoacyl-[acyl-carrier-protein] reductase [SAR202 cluster bacterium]|tara:strand:- start:74616 stop:75368 length:753 start_codon:yes stop_codon:yes gene_type:complete
MNESSTKSKTALVTGAAKGIGKAIALELAKKGIQVAINYKSSESEALEVCKKIESSGIKSQAFQADVSDNKAVISMIKDIENKLGNIDILVNNAGIIDDKHLIRMSDDSWHNVINTNLNGTFYCTRAVLRKMISSKWGRIINISSIVGLRGNPTQTNYTASKAAVIGFTKALAKEVATKNITANVITPGYYETETTSVLTPEMKKFWLERIPQGKFGDVENVATLAGFLTSQDATYITGQVISVDGGLAI